MFLVLLLVSLVPPVFAQSLPEIGSLLPILELPTGAVGLELYPPSDTPRGPESFFEEIKSAAITVTPELEANLTINTEGLGEWRVNGLGERSSKPPTRAKSSAQF